MLHNKTATEIAALTSQEHPGHEALGSYVDYLCLPEVFTFCLDRSVELIRELVIQPDFIACRGVSGALIAGAVAANLGMPLVLVRKNDDSHCLRKGRPVGFQGSRYVIVDDFIATGKTIEIIREALVPSILLAVCVTKPDWISNKVCRLSIAGGNNVLILAVSGLYYEDEE